MTRHARDVLRARKRERDFTTPAVALWALAQGMDLGMTVVALRFGGTEAWPPTAIAFALAGVLGVVIYKLALVAVTPVVVVLQRREHRARLWLLSAVLTAPVIAWNLLQLL